MATYYRWRKSNVLYTEVVRSGPSGLGHSGWFDYYPSYSLDPNTGKFSGVGSYTRVNFETVAKATVPALAYIQYGFSDYRTSNVTVATWDDSDSTINFSPNLQDLDSSPGPGAFVEYVYSTNSSAYPNGGVFDGYYYDQRTTVTSPTAPSGLTVSPNPINTTQVTVSWTAATSNISNYPVNLYEVSYKPNTSDAWTTAGTTSGTSLQVTLPLGITSVQFRVRARDSNNKWGSYVTSSSISVLFAPTLTVPSQAMLGQQITVTWTAFSGADSYTVQRKANTDTDWTQVYSGTALTFSETVGTWTSVQYRVQAVFDGTAGGWAESAAIPVVSASSLVISGTDEDLGVVTNDIPYSISTDTGNQITATITVNNAVIFSGNVGNSTADVIPVLDLITGEGTIVISATVEASGGRVTATRTWTYEKAAITFPNSGSVAQITKEGENIYPKVLAEGVRLPGGKTLDQVMGFPCQIYTGTEYGINNNDELVFPFTPKALLVFSGVTLALFIRGSNTGYCSVSSNSYEDSTLEWKENSIRFVDSPFVANQTYTYVCFG